MTTFADYKKKKIIELNLIYLCPYKVIGVLESNASIYYLSSQPVHPYRTATSLMIHCQFSPSLNNVTTMLYHLIKHIYEVSSVTVQGEKWSKLILKLKMCLELIFSPERRHSYRVFTAPSITNMRVANVTSTSFCVYWSSQFPGNESYTIVISKGSKVIYFNDTSETMLEMRGLQAGALYDVIVTPHACGRHGNNIQILDATARLTNVEYTSDLQNTSSAAYTNLTASIYMEVRKDSAPRIHNYLRKENDCSPFATCNNTWGSYTCTCLEGFVDINPKRPGRSCQGINQSTNASVTTIFVAMTSTTAAPTTSTITLTTSTAAPTTTITSMTTTTAASITTSTPLKTTTVSPSTTTVTTTTTIAMPTTATSPPTSAAVSRSPLTPTVSTTTTTTTSVSSTTTGSTTNTSTISASESITVKCNMASITVTVAKDFLQSSHITEGALYLGMADCGVNGGNSTHAQLTVAWDECNTVLMHVSRTFHSQNQHLIKPLFCTELIQHTVWTKLGYFFLSPSEAVVLMVSLNTSVDKIKVVINKCWATPTPIPTTFLDRCSVNPYTTVITNGNSSTSSLSVKIFSFVDLSIIYLHCQVEICVEIGPDSCAPVSRGTEASLYTHTVGLCVCLHARWTGLYAGTGHSSSLFY
uniref:Uromodulin-like 1 n=1 Tax=Periophthalmus magnuspinnatus TaxID=409849 RepID=A0A3B3ZGI6_9GOBI